MSIVASDTECYKNYYYAGFKRISDGYRVGFELSRRTGGWDHQRVRNILLKNTIVGFNYQNYDRATLWLALWLSKNEYPIAKINRILKTVSDGIIKGNVKWWTVEEFINDTLTHTFGIHSRFQFHKNDDFIDLIEPQPNAIASLKTLNGRLHGRRLQDLPFDPDADLTDAEIDQTNDYCLTSDLDATDNLLGALRENLELRLALGKEYGQDFRSKSDSQIGEAIVKKRVEQITRTKVQKVDTRPGTTFRYPIPSFMKFERADLQEIVDRLRETDFVIDKDGKVNLPKWLNDTKITIGDSTYQMGIGGLHSTESGRAIRSDEDYVLVDADVASQYPSIIEKLGLFPKALGPVFLQVYSGIKQDRIKAKKRAKEIKEILKKLAPDAADRKALEVELLACTVKDKGLKISLNGCYGKLGSRHSILYAPHLLCSVTLTGQLTLLMLIERAERAGIGVVSGNTDGVLFRCPRSMFDGLAGDRLKPSTLAEICGQWEKDTGFDLEFAEYRAIYNRDVNNYIAIKANGGHKRKGVLGNWTADDPNSDDYDPRMVLMKNPAAGIVSDAALNLIKFETPIEDTIYGCKDIRQFVSVIKVDGGATWRGKYLGKVVRYYWAEDGDVILRHKPNAQGTHAQVPKSEGAAPCMTLPDDFPDDIDYGRYLAETRKLLVEIGHTWKPPEVSRIQTNKQVRAIALRDYFRALAAA